MDLQILPISFTDPNFGFWLGIALFVFDIISDLNFSAFCLSMTYIHIKIFVNHGSPRVRVHLGYF